MPCRFLSQLRTTALSCKGIAPCDLGDPGRQKRKQTAEQLLRLAAGGRLHGEVRVRFMLQKTALREGNLHDSVCTGEAAARCYASIAPLCLSPCSVGSNVQERLSARVLICQVVTEQETTACARC